MCSNWEFDDGLVQLEEPKIVRVCGFSFAVMGSSFTDHLPSGPASAVFDCPANFTVIFVPGVSQPQMGSDCFC